jgi:hypothetical protein
MSRRKRKNRRLHAVPDPQPTGPGDRGHSGREPGPGLYAVPDLDPPAEPSSAVVELVRELERMGMPREIVEHGMAFGDDAEELELWVRGLQLALAGDPLSGLLTPWEPLLARRTTVLEAELGGAEILASYADMGDEDPVEILSRLMAEAQRSGKPEALAMCRMVAHLGPAETREQATGTADSLVAAGVRDLPWVGQLGTARFHRSYGIRSPGKGRVQVLEFAYGPKVHVLAVLTCDDCGGVQSLRFTDAAAALYTELRLDAKDSGLRLIGATATEAARIVRDALDVGICLDEESPDEDGDDLAVLLPVLLERLSRMPDAHDD